MQNNVVTLDNQKHSLRPRALSSRLRQKQITCGKGPAYLRAAYCVIKNDSGLLGAASFAAYHPTD